MENEIRCAIEIREVEGKPTRLVGTSLALQRPGKGSSGDVLARFGFLAGRWNWCFDRQHQQRRNQSLQIHYPFETGGQAG